MDKLVLSGLFVGAWALVFAVVGCRQEPPEPVDAVPVAEALPRVPTREVGWATDNNGAEVRVWRDPDGCQYLVFYEQYHGEPAAVSVRYHPGSNGVCMSSREP